MLHEELRPPAPSKEIEELGRREAELDRAIQQSRGALQRASSEEREKLRAEIAEQVKGQFQVRQDLRRLVLQRIKQDVERLEASIQRREEGKAGLIERRIQDLLGEGGDDF
jgi:Spy/CpxP family protein refolding chaperone